jgi:hypothetical protein
VSFTACPARCAVPGTTLVIPPLTRKLNFTAVNGVEGRISSGDLAFLIQTALKATRIQISHTGSGHTVAGTPYNVRWEIPYTKYKQLCLDPEDDGDPNTNPAPICAYWEQEGLSGQVVYHTYTPLLTSYIDFGPAAEASGAPDILPLPVDPYEHEIPTWKRAAFLALQGPVGTLLGTDIDRVRLLVNNLNTTLFNAADLPVSLEGGGITFGVTFASDHPSIVCEAHWQAKTAYVLSLTEGWSDELCPDFDLSQMGLSINLRPGVVNGALTVLDAQVTVNLVPRGVQSQFIDVLFDATDKAETAIAAKMRGKLLEPRTRTDLGEVLTAVLKARFKDMGRIASAQIVGDEWVVRYEPVSTQPVNFVCPTCISGR